MVPVLTLACHMQVLLVVEVSGQPGWRRRYMDLGGDGMVRGRQAASTADMKEIMRAGPATNPTTLAGGLQIQAVWGGCGGGGPHLQHLRLRGLVFVCGA